MTRPERSAQRDRQLLLVQLLSRIVYDVRRARGLPVAGDLGGVEPPGILRFGRPDRREAQAELCPLLGLAPELRHEHCLLRAVVVAVATLPGPSQAGHVARRPVGSREGRRVPGEVVRTEHGAERDPWLRARLEGGDRDQAPTTASVKGRDRAADDLDALHEDRVERVQLRLAVRQGGRHPIDEHLDPSHAERRARTIAANRDARVLGEVARGLREDPGNQVEGLVKAERWSGPLDLFGRDHGDGSRCLEQNGRTPHRLGLVEGDAGRVVLGGRERSQRQEQGGNSCSEVRWIVHGRARHPITARGREETGPRKADIFQ